MTLKKSVFQRVHLNLLESSSFPEGLRGEFKSHLALLNFRRAQYLILLLLLTNFLLFLTDYFNYQKGLWSLNSSYKLLFQANLAMGVWMVILILAASFLRFSSSKFKMKLQVSFTVVTSLLSLCIAASISGGLDQQLHAHITLYTLALFGIAALIYLDPRISFLIILGSYVVFVGTLRNFQPDYYMFWEQAINTVLLALVAWLISSYFYRLHIRDFHYQLSIESIVKERTAKLEEVNCQLEEEILEKQRLDDELTQFFKAALDIICIFNFNYLVTRVNEALQNLLGYSIDEVKMKSLLEYIHTEDRQRMAEVLEERKIKVSPLTKLETRMLCKNGKYILVEWTIVTDADRQLYFAVGRDVTERNRDQEKIYRLASIVESTDDGIIGMDTEGTVMYWNPGAERVYGYSQEEIVGKSISMIFHVDRHDELVEIFSKAQKGEKISHLETERRHKNGKMIDVSITVSPIKDDLGKVIGVSTILQDISAKKQIERELARLDRLNLIGEMAAGISHEVRNPMTTVRGFLQLLYEKEGNAGNRSYYDLMIAELDRANAILTEFLSISRTQMTERKSQNLNEIIKSMAPLLEASAVSSNKRIQIELEELPDLLLDDKETRQVILNLSRNGLEAMDEGGTLTLRTSTKENEVILEVRDQGHGISPELIGKLGTPFLTTKCEGTGLGLAICYGIAARHEALIEVESGGSGSTFYVRYQIAR